VLIFALDGVRVKAPDIIGSEAEMKYKVVLHESEEGFSVSCPGLPGCWSQGRTEAEALENIQDAIAEYLATVETLVQGQEVREVSVTS
jgi:predicted RNase H-like HicB family nuclease